MVLLVAALLLLAVQVAYADSIQVTTPDDVVDANGGNCVGLAASDLPGADALVSLREALCAANTNPNPDTILLLAETYVITQTGSGENFNNVGDLDILEAGGDLTISGAGASTTIIDGNGSVIGDRVLDIPFDTTGYITVTISGVTLQHGSVPGGLGGGLYVNRGHNIRIQNSTVYSNTAQDGGGIWTRSATLEITDSMLSDNRAIWSGGGIYHGPGGGTISIYQSTLAGNQATGPNEVQGGGIYNAQDKIQISLSTLSDNQATSTAANAAAGGAIYSRDGTIDITTSELLNNTASGPLVASIGGGISLRDGGVSITFSTISGNTAANTAGDAAFGGGMSCDSAAVTITHSLISANRSGGSGGGIDLNDGSLVMTNTTVSGNQAVNSGGGIYNAQATAQLDHVTVTDNVADNDRDEFGSGGGIFRSIGLTELKNTILAGNVDKSPSPVNKHPDCFGNATSHGYNLIGDQNGCETTTWLGTDQVGGNSIDTIDPLLHSLADNGGPAFSHALRPGSPALDAGSCTDIGGDTVGNDQRDWSRPVNVKCDIGAIEAEPDLSIFKAATPATPIPRYGEVTYSIELANSSAAYVDGVNVVDPLPTNVTFARWLPGGQPTGATVTSDTLTWNGTVTGGQTVSFEFVVTHTGDFCDIVTNTAEYSYYNGGGFAEATFAVTPAIKVYLPIVLKSTQP